MPAVITGDIVNSSLLTAKEKTKLVNELTAYLRNSKFKFYRGDSFQLYLPIATDALTITFKIRTIARTFGDNYDVRISIGLGVVNEPIKELNTADGEAFILSGRGFDELANDQRLRIMSSNENANSVFRLMAYFADHLLQRLTFKQAQVVLQLLEGNTQTQAAETLKKTQSTINKHAQSAEWQKLDKLLLEYKNALNQFSII